MENLEFYMEVGSGVGRFPRKGGGVKYPLGMAGDITLSIVGDYNSMIF